MEISDQGAVAAPPVAAGAVAEAPPRSVEWPLRLFQLGVALVLVLWWLGLGAVAWLLVA